MALISLREFADRIGTVMPVITREFARRQIHDLYRSRITLAQFFVLEYLHAHGETKMTALAQFMRVSTAAMTGIVERLVREHAVTRIFDDADRRIIKVRLTAKGEKFVRKMNDQRRRMVIHIFDRISARDRSAYLRILMQIQEILCRERP